VKIDVVVPVTTPGLSVVEDFQAYARPDTDVTLNILDCGPSSVESYYDEVLAMPDVVRRVVEAERRGSDAVVIDCAGDPGLSAAREVASVLVLGPAQTSMHVAAMLAHNFSVVTTLQAVVPMMEDLAKQYGLADKLRSVRAVDIPVLELEDESRLRAALLDEALKAVEEDGAHAIVLGCTGMRGCSDQLHAQLAERGHPGIPVIDPALTAFKIAEALVDLNLAPSQRTYPAPADKKVVGYDAVVSAVRG
jgi:allantoin racemase